MTHNIFNPGKKRDKCDIHGEYENLSYIFGHWVGCPDCNEEAMRREDERYRQEQERERKLRILKAGIDQSLIPERFLTRTLDNYIPENQQQQKALAVAREYANNIDEACKKGSSLIFCGKPGTGKTHLAIGIAQHAIREKNKSALFITVMKVIRRIKSTWGGKSDETEQQAIDIFAKPDLLILDEVGVQFGTKTEEDLLFDVINTRYEKCKPTIIISNLDLNGVKQYLGERAFDRLREDGGKHVAFTWGSYRAK